MIDIIAILDRSGSMSDLQDTVISTFNEFLDNQKKLEGEARLTVVTFGTDVTTIVNRVPLEEAVHLNRDTFRIDGMTALYDAIGSTIHKAAYASKAIVMIHTDGQENSSKEYTKESVRTLIESHEDWEFHFFGSDLSSMDDARSMGIRNVVGVTNDRAGMEHVYLSMNALTRMYRGDNP